MELVLYIIIILLLLTGTIVCLFYPEKYLKYREKSVNSRDIETLRLQGILLFCAAIFFIVMFIKNI
jgi:hypothetical protein